MGGLSDGVAPGEKAEAPPEPLAPVEVPEDIDHVVEEDIDHVIEEHIDERVDETVEKPVPDRTGEDVGEDIRPERE